MKKCIESEIILNWFKLKKADKTKLLQEYEDQNAKLFERETRKVNIAEVGPELKNEVRGFYCHHKPEQINIVDNDTLNESGLYALSVTYHEGLHASIHDIITGRHTNLKLYQDLPFKRLFHNTYFDVKNPSEYSREEKLVWYETLCNNASLVLNNSETIDDIAKVYKPYLAELFAYYTFKQLCHREERNLQNPELDYKISDLITRQGNELKKYYPEAIVSHQQDHLRTRDHVNSVIEIMENKKNKSPLDVANEVNGRIIIDSHIIK